MFDFDGTIVDSMKELTIIASGLINKYYGFSISFAERLYIETSGLPFCQQMEIMFPGCEKNKIIVEIFENSKGENFWNYKIFPDTAMIMDYLRGKGILVVLSSNNFRDVIDRFLKKQNIIVDEVLGFDAKNGLCKGRPHFDFINLKYGIGYKNITLVGDLLKDGEKAISNSVRFMGRTGIITRDRFISTFGNIRIIDELTELTEII